MEVGTGELATILGITERQVQKLEAKGVLSKAGHGAWPLAVSVQAYVQHRLQADRKRTQGGSSGGSASDKLKEIKAQREALRLAREERELVPLADAIFAMDVVAGAVALEVNNLPARFTRDLDERERLQREIDDALACVAKRIQERSEALEAGREPGPPEDEDDAG